MSHPKEKIENRSLEVVYLMDYGKLGRCHLKGVIGDQIHATLVAVAHNFRAILRKLRLFCVTIFGWIRSVVLPGSEKIGLLKQAA